MNTRAPADVATPGPIRPATPVLAAAEIDASCRVPLLLMFSKAAGALVFSSIFALIASIKFHSPDFLAQFSWLTYGRVYPAATNAFLYGFCLQAGVAVALWMLCRLGHTRLAQPGLITLGALVWNVAVFVGVIGILAGHSTGFEWLEFPPYATPALLLGYLMVAVWGIFTFHYRRERVLFVSQWFIFAALFWFPWIYVTAESFLVFFPVRGVLQAVVNWWFMNNLGRITLGFLGLAMIFYFIPKVLQRPLYSSYLAMLSFWLLLLFGSWGGIHAGAPLPAWIPALSAVGTVMTIIPLAAIGYNCDRTLRGQYSALTTSYPLRFVFFGAVSFLLGGFIESIFAMRELNQWVEFTYFTKALAYLNLYGFFAMTAAGAIYYIAPGLTNQDWPHLSLVRAHFWLAAVGLLLIVAPLAVAGIVQGSQWANPQVPFIDTVRVSMRFFRVTTIGELLLLAAHAVFAWNIIRLIYRWCPRYFVGLRAPELSSS